MQNFTVTPSPAPTPRATDTPSRPPEPTLDFGPDAIHMLVVADSFSLSVPFPLHSESQGNLVFISDEAQTLNISFVGDTTDAGLPLLEVIDLFLASLEDRGGQFLQAKPVDIVIDGVEGIAVDLTGVLGEKDIEGRAIAVATGPDFVFFGIAISNIVDGNSTWASRDLAIFEGLTGTLTFTDVNAECPIATDPAYGYQPESAVQVGGGDFDGPSRERVYLDHLRGPNGGALSYERNGSTMAGDVILDIYHITGPSIDAIIYVDEYGFSEPMAPRGFTCDGAFPLQAP
ncbi:MAG TPA: hypothetical protein VGJ22_04370 [Anaerolineales bacterium]|jgi:hypothetical protein